MSTSSAANTGCSKLRHPAGYAQKKSALPGRFFICLSLWLLPFAYSAATDVLHDPRCRTDNYDEKITVEKVIDGDTVILADDRHVRLVGINTPEIGRDGEVSEPGAEEARDYLARLVRTNPSLHLRFDTEKHDRFKRTLAHLFLPNGLNLQALMLSRGLAMTLTIPPNLDFLDCYQASVNEARKHHIGLWALRHYQPLPVEQVTPDDLGYRVVIGTVTRMGESDSAIWLNLAPRFALRIVREDLVYFDAAMFRQIVGRKVVAQGRLYLGNGEFRMRIHHPVDLQLPDRN